jgi:hypothetical protein
VQVLKLPPCPTVCSAIGPMPNDHAYILPGKAIAGAAPLRLGFLAIADMAAPRTANIVLHPKHPFWDVKTADGVYEYLEACFPQADRLRECVPRDVAQARLCV